MLSRTSTATISPVGAPGDAIAELPTPVSTGGGGHGLATAFYLAKEHGIGSIAVLEKGWLGGGNVGRNTTIVRSNYLLPATSRSTSGRCSCGRATLVGIKPADRSARLRAGAHFIGEGAEAVARNDQGHVTSVAFSPELGHWIGLGLLARGPARHGQRVRAYDPVRGGDTLVEVCDPVFLDPEGERLRG